MTVDTKTKTKTETKAKGPKARTFVVVLNDDTQHAVEADDIKFKNSGTLDECYEFTLKHKTVGIFPLQNVKLIKSVEKPIEPAAVTNTIDLKSWDQYGRFIPYFTRSVRDPEAVWFKYRVNV